MAKLELCSFEAEAEAEEEEIEVETEPATGPGSRCGYMGCILLQPHFGLHQFPALPPGRRPTRKPDMYESVEKVGTPYKQLARMHGRKQRQKSKQCGIRKGQRDPRGSRHGSEGARCEAAADKDDASAKSNEANDRLGGNAAAPAAVPVMTLFEQAEHIAGELHLSSWLQTSPPQVHKIIEDANQMLNITPQGSLKEQASAIVAACSAA